MTAFDPADIAALRQQGDLKEFLLSLGGRAPAKRAARSEPEGADYTIPHLGAWPLGTAATGVAPAEHSCPRCRAQARPSLVAIPGARRDHPGCANDYSQEAA
ncbi:hypothetical protein OIU81_03165 [Streptomyces sp. NBC_01454]|uniref:hypothetical protein n=1 Tax=Streptomyces sp. NBC_01454 TaxID=2975867 RepID=UPI002E316353|nr:hypothetical protein [Streptomyces sp. NBC_01454]